MITYRHVFELAGTTQAREIDATASRPCKARTIARLILNAETRGGIGWTLVSQTILETT